jgi:hypothetical protein
VYLAYVVSPAQVRRHDLRHEPQRKLANGKGASRSRGTTASGVSFGAEKLVRESRLKLASVTHADD